MTFDMKRNILGGQESECGLGYEHFARSPALEGKPPAEAPQCPLLGVQVGEVACKPREHGSRALQANISGEPTVLVAAPPGPALAVRGVEQRLQPRWQFVRQFD
jgi:hypothetical protein